MALKIYWTDFAKNELKKIFNFYKDEASIRVATKLTTEIVKEALKLQQHPNIGQKEELLESRDQSFRYLIYKNYKIIYWTNTGKSRIEIVDVFDTRQNPIK
ncbi:MAG: type II toxin-antitoxin system RelE/ParE family toxin [Bacteroidales bacterium]|jgi:plasmid stabilization system protein ParE|nr:type II toxin-antitoxin system RelE/ParE family toxin [Bacteroidales bacterium]